MPLSAVLCEYPAIRAADIKEALRTTTSPQIFRKTEQVRKGFPERQLLPKTTTSGRLPPEEPSQDQPYITQSAMKIATDLKAPILGPAFRKMLLELSQPDIAPQSAMPSAVPLSKGKGKNKEKGKRKSKGSRGSESQ